MAFQRRRDSSTGFDEGWQYSWGFEKSGSKVSAASERIRCLGFGSCTRAETSPASWGLQLPHACRQFSNVHILLVHPPAHATHAASRRSTRSRIVLAGIVTDGRFRGKQQRSN